MVRRADDDQAIVGHGRARQRGIGDLAFREAQVGRAVENGRRDIGRVALVQHDGDVGIGGPVGHQEGRQPVAGDRLAGLDRQAPASHAAEFRQRQFAEPRAPVRRLGFGKKRAPGPAQLDPAADPVEEADAIAAFQRVDGRADRRRRQVQAFRRPGKVLALGDGDEDAQLVEGQDRSVEPNKTLHIFQ